MFEALLIGTLLDADLIFFSKFTFYVGFAFKIFGFKLPFMTSAGISNVLIGIFSFEIVLGGTY